MVEPPLSAGAFQDISIFEPSANVLVGAEGEPGATAALKLTGSEGRLLPTSFEARILYA